MDDLAVGRADTLEPKPGVTPMVIPDGVDRTVFRSVVAAYTTAWRTKGARPTAAEIRMLWPNITEARVSEILVLPEFRAAMTGRGIDIGDTPGLTHQQHLYLLSLGDINDRRSEKQKALAVGATTQQVANWNRLPLFIRARQALAARLFEDSIPTIQTTMVQQAVGGSYKHQEFIMETMGEGPKAREQQSAKEAIQEIVAAIQRATVGQPEVRQRIMEEIQAGRMALGSALG